MTSPKCVKTDTQIVELQRTIARHRRRLTRRVATPLRILATPFLESKPSNSSVKWTFSRLVWSVLAGRWLAEFVRSNFSESVAKEKPFDLFLVVWSKIRKSRLSELYRFRKHDENEHTDG